MRHDHVGHFTCNDCDRAETWAATADGEAREDFAPCVDCGSFAWTWVRSVRPRGPSARWSDDTRFSLQSDKVASIKGEVQPVTAGSQVVRLEWLPDGAWQWFVYLQHTAVYLGHSMDRETAQHECEGAMMRAEDLWIESQSGPEPQISAAEVDALAAAAAAARGDVACGACGFVRSAAVDSCPECPGS